MDIKEQAVEPIYLGFIPQISGLPPFVMWFLIVMIGFHLMAFVLYLVCLLNSFFVDPIKEQKRRLEAKFKTE